MGFKVTFEPVLLEFAPEQREAWNAGERSDCPEGYCKGLPGTLGFGEYLAGKYWEQRGYRWIHHDFNVFGANRAGKYPESEAILKTALGEDALEAARHLYKTLFPLREPGHVPFEEPDLLIFKPDGSEVRFAECKRMDTQDTINSRQVLGLFFLGAVLGCPVDVFAIAETGTCDSPASITFEFPPAAS